MTPKIKICCIANIEEAQLAIKTGASAIGLVGNMPSGPGIITDELIHTIAKNIPPHIDTFFTYKRNRSQKYHEPSQKNKYQYYSVG